ncbi:MAG: DUF3737 family protein [Proteobacteria bacterium]|nr:DUF3737 family protein [Pseudomonadota bacterium]
MDRELKQGQIFTGERALFMSRDLHIKDSMFADGESPLKESRNIVVEHSSFQWKYPLWYCHDIEVHDCSFFNMARAGIWYVNNITLSHCLYEAPKGLRRVKGLKLDHVNFTQALETLWNCEDVEMNDVTARGDYFGMGCSNLRIRDFNLVGNYSFDGCKNVEIHNAKLLCKDAFWNCENVVIYDSYISGEYIGWNSKNVTFVNCMIESLQGFCYMDNVVLKNCKLINTTLSFEYSTVDAEITTEIESVKNPTSGRIRCARIKELIFDDPNIDRNLTQIIETEKQSS